MTRALGFLVALLLCAASVVNAASVYAAASATPAPCPMPATDDGAHSHGACGEPEPACVQFCNAFAGLLSSQDAGLSVLPGERVAAGARDAFRSHAGPPGLQPPR